MPTFHDCVLYEASLTTGSAMDLGAARYIGDHNHLHLVVRIHQPATGDAPALVFQHAATNEEGAYVDFDPPLSVGLTGSDPVWVHTEGTLRFLRWTTTGTFETPAIVTVDAVGKP